MMLFNCFVLVLIAVEIRAAAIAFENAEDEMYPVILAQVREKRSPFPGRAMMFHGYFGHPHNGYGTHNGRSYDPQGAMTAFAAGDSVSAGSSYYGHGGGYDCSNCGVQKPSNGNDKNGNGNGHPTNGNGFHNHHEEPNEVPADNGKPVNGEEPQPAPEPTAIYPNGNGNGNENGNGNGNGNGADNEVPQETGGEEGYLGDQPAAEETPKGETLPPAVPTLAAAPSEKPKRIPVESDEEEEEDDEPSFISHKGRGRGRGRGPYYNSYFPMVFGAFPGYGGGRGGNGEEGGAYNPGVATAIANSFSTGRGAVATSHATAYGGPQVVPQTFRKNGSRTRNHS